MRNAPFHLVAQVVLKNMFSETFESADMWEKLVALSEPEEILDAQLLAARTFLQVSDGVRLSPGQKRLIQLRPTLSDYLSTLCARGCEARMPDNAEVCAGCKRAYYASMDCRRR